MSQGAIDFGLVPVKSASNILDPEYLQKLKELANHEDRRKLMLNEYKHQKFMLKIFR